MELRNTVSEHGGPNPQFLAKGVACEYASSTGFTTWTRMGVRKIFSRVGQWGGLKDGSPPAGTRGNSPVGVWGEAPRSWHFLKMMHKYFVHWGLRQHLQQKHFHHFQGEGQVSPLPMPAGAHVDTPVKGTTSSVVWLVTSVIGDVVGGENWSPHQ